MNPGSPRGSFPGSTSKSLRLTKRPAHAGTLFPRGPFPTAGPSHFLAGGPLSFWGDPVAGWPGPAASSVPPRPHLSPAASAPWPGGGATGMRGGRGAGGFGLRPGPGWMGGRRADENLADSTGAGSLERVRPALAPLPAHVQLPPPRVGWGAQPPDPTVSEDRETEREKSPREPALPAQSRPVPAGGSGPGGEGGGGRGGAGARVSAPPGGRGSPRPQQRGLGRRRGALRPGPPHLRLARLLARRRGRRTRLRPRRRRPRRPRREAPYKPPLGRPRGSSPPHPGERAEAGPTPDRPRPTPDRPRRRAGPRPASAPDRSWICPTLDRPRTDPGPGQTPRLQTDSPRTQAPAGAPPAGRGMLGPRHGLGGV